MATCMFSCTPLTVPGSVPESVPSYRAERAVVRRPAEPATADSTPLPSPAGRSAPGLKRVSAVDMLPGEARPRGAKPQVNGGKRLSGSGVLINTAPRTSSAPDPSRHLTTHVVLSSQQPVVGSTSLLGRWREVRTRRRGASAQEFVKLPFSGPADQCGYRLGLARPHSKAAGRTGLPWSVSPIRYNRALTCAPPLQALVKD